MKHYTTYSKADAPYFNLSEFLFFPVAPLAAVGVVSYLILYFLGLTPTILINVVAALVANTIYYGFRNFSPNGGSSRNRSDLPEMIPSFLFILGAEFIINVGVYVIVVYQKTGVFHQWYFYAWFFVVFVLPVLYFLTRNLIFLRLVRFQKSHFRSLHLSVTFDAELQVHIEKISFLNTKKKLIGNVSINDHVAIPYPEQFRAMSLEDRNRYLYSRIFSETVYIPREADRLLLSWYSVTEDIYYQSEIDFPFHKLFYEKPKDPLNDPKRTRDERLRPITLSIREEGKIQLYSRDGNIIEPGIIRAQPADETKKKRILGFTAYEWLQNKPKEDNSELLARVKQRSQIAGFLFNWQITGSGLAEHALVVDTMQTYEDFGRNAVPDTFVKRPLPIQMEFSHDRYTWATFFIDAEKLYDVLQASGTLGADISFEVTLDVEEGDASLVLKSGNHPLPFTAVEKKIVPSCLKVVQEKFHKKKVENEKNELVKSIYDLIQQKQYAEAQTQCKKALEKFPDFALIYFYEARLLWYTQGYEVSYEQEHYFVEKTQHDAFALARIYNHYGCLHDEEKHYEEALSFFKKAFATYPKEVIYQANIAEIYYRLKDIEQTLHHADECVRRGYTSDMISEILALRT